MTVTSDRWCCTLNPTLDPCVLAIIQQQWLKCSPDWASKGCLQAAVDFHCCSSIHTDHDIDASVHQGWSIDFDQASSQPFWLPDRSPSIEASSDEASVNSGRSAEGPDHLSAPVSGLFPFIKDVTFRHRSSAVEFLGLTLWFLKDAPYWDIPG